MKLAICFTNFGPYHLARLRALGAAIHEQGGRLLAYEVAGAEQRYPWRTDRRPEPFEWITLFPERRLERLPGSLCVRAMREALDRDRPDALAIVGYSRPESMAALSWGRSAGRPTILLSESQAIDHPRVWWKESIKRRRVGRFSSALVGGGRHRDYLIDLGMPAERIAFGYNAVDNALYARRADRARVARTRPDGFPGRPYFLAVSRFVPEKNLPRLVRAFAAFRRSTTAEQAWDLVLCGGGPGEEAVRAAVESSGFAGSIHCPGFLQSDVLSQWYAHASAFVHPSLMEPWGLVVNEAAATGLPLLVSDRAGCVETLVPEPPGTTGRRFDPSDEPGLCDALGWVARLPAAKRDVMGRRASEIVAEWGPERFAQGMLEVLELAVAVEQGRRPSFAMAGA